MTDVERYRKLHKNCKWCQHAEFVSPSLRYNVNCPDYWDCRLKDQMIRCQRLKAFFCGYYKLKSTSKY